MKKQFIRNQILFARYGHLSPISHKKYIKNKLNNKQGDVEEWDKNIGYHSPPMKKGIYAFVYPYIDKFLLSAPSFSGIESTHPKVEFVKDKNGKKIVFNSKLIYEKSDKMVGYYNLEALIDKEQIACFKKCCNKKNELLKDCFFAEDKIKELNYVVKRVKPKIFSYDGEIWHHLENYLESRGSILEKKGSWVKTDFYDYKKALQKALGQCNLTNFRHYKYCWDMLEVFIEKV